MSFLPTVNGSKKLNNKVEGKIKILLHTIC